MDLNRSSVAKGHSHNETEINSTPLYTYEIFISKNWKIYKKRFEDFLIKIETFFSTLLRFTYNMSYPTFVLSEVCPFPSFVLSYVCLIRRFSHPTFVTPTFVLLPWFQQNIRYKIKKENEFISFYNLTKTWN